MTLREAAFLHSGLVLYAIAVVLLFSAVRRGSPPLLKWGRATLFGGAALHVGLLTIRGHFAPANLFEFTLLLSALLSLLALAIDLGRRMPILSVGLAPIALSFALVAVLVGRQSARPLPSLWAATHVVITLVSFGAFAVAFVGGLLYLFEQRQLKARVSTPILGFLPSLEALYRMTVISVGLGLAFLTAGFLVGYGYARSIQAATDKAWRTDPKVILTTATWLAYVLVVVAAAVPAYRGRRTAMASVVSFVFVILAFWVSAVWSPFHNFR